MPSSPSTYRPPPMPNAAPAPVSRVLRAGAVVGAGVIAAELAAIPAAMRIAPAVPTEGTVNAWLVLVACAIVPATLAVAIFRGAREGLRAFGGPDAGLHAFGFAAWALASFGFMAALGTVLRATTHHHGLAGVTFAIVSLVASLLVALIVRRLVSMLERATLRTRATLEATVVVVGALSLIAAGAVLTRVTASNALLAPATRAMFVDGLAFAIATGFLSRAVFARRFVLALLGLPVAVGMIVLGASILRRSATLPESPLPHAIAERAPAFAPAADLFLRR